MKDSRATFIGTTINTKRGNSYYVYSVAEVTKHREAKFALLCSVCSKDTELWPEGSIVAYKTKIRSGQLLCGCSLSPKWSTCQNEIRAKRRCEELGYKYHGFLGSKLIGTTKLILENENGIKWDTTSLARFLDKTKPIVGQDKGAIKEVKVDYDKYLPLFKASGCFESEVRFSKEGGVWYHTCPVCSKDEFVINGLCSGNFPSDTTRLCAGRKSCRCNGKFRFTKEQREFKIKERLKGAEFLGWRGGYKNAFSKFKWRCDSGHECETRVDTYLNKGVGCPSCARHGFNPEKPAYFYLVRWDNKEVSYLKYGITGQASVLKRIRQQELKSELSYEILYTKFFENGAEAKSIEDELKTVFGRKGVCPRNLMRDGFDETIYDTEENINLIYSKINT